MEQPAYGQAKLPCKGSHFPKADRRNPFLRLGDQGPKETRFWHTGWGEKSMIRGGATAVRVSKERPDSKRGYPGKKSNDPGAKIGTAIRNASGGAVKKPRVGREFYLKKRTGEELGPKKITQQMSQVEWLTAECFEGAEQEVPGGG